MMTMKHEPIVSVGLMAGVESAVFELKGDFIDAARSRFAAGSYRVAAVAGRVDLADINGEPRSSSAELRLAPVEAVSSFIIRDVTIGIQFHWQRKQDQEFLGALKIKLDSEGRLVLINEIAVEAYLNGAISSEMSANAHPELLKAHTIIARSWLLAQLESQLGSWKRPHAVTALSQQVDRDSGELIRWYGRDSHADFDICADDHCQRYQGITKATSPAVFESVRATFGQVLTYDGVLCDTRYSKSCGGMTESYDAAWEDMKIPYLSVFYDGESFPAEFKLPLSHEANAEAWIRNSPPAFCHTDDPDIFRKILTDFDQETADFYRWRTVIAQEQLQEWLSLKLGIDFGIVKRLEPVERGGSGRIVRLKIVGERETVTIGKELEIRRVLSAKHLYSSAFVVVPNGGPNGGPNGEPDGGRAGSPRSFTLLGAGWGHGVGLCQIGAALMAERGYNYQQILTHYYPGAQLHNF